MRDLIEYIIKALVDKPEEVNIDETQSESVIMIEIRVAAEDAGKVIGREGRLINALRTLAKAAGAKEKKRITVEVITKEEK